MRGFLMLLLAASTLLLSGSFRANAQRTMRGQYHASAEVVMTADKGVPIGGELSFGQYLLCSYWNAWINVSPDYIPLDSTVMMRYIPLTGGADYMHRIAATRSRSVNLYIGAGAFLGYEFYDPWKTVPPYMETGREGGAFIYGLSPGLVSEFFMTRAVALTLSARMPVSFSSQAKIIKAHIKAGIRINI